MRGTKPREATKHRLYECGCCDSLHPWNWNGDCREDAHRYADEQDYAERNRVSVWDVEVLSMSDRVEADERGES